MAHEAGRETERDNRHCQVELREGDLSAVVGGNSDPEDPIPAHRSGS
jgi:hypothetical protein